MLPRVRPWLGRGGSWEHECGQGFERICSLRLAESSRHRRGQHKLWDSPRSQSQQPTLCCVFHSMHFIQWQIWKQTPLFERKSVFHSSFCCVARVFWVVARVFVSNTLNFNTWCICLEYWMFSDLCKIQLKLNDWMKSDVCVYKTH